TRIARPYALWTVRVRGPDGSVPRRAKVWARKSLSWNSTNTYREVCSVNVWASMAWTSAITGVGGRTVTADGAASTTWGLSSRRYMETTSVLSARNSRI